LAVLKNTKKTEGLKTFLDKIFKEWKETEDLKVYLEKEFHYDKPLKDSACEDNCYSFKMYMYGLAFQSLLLFLLFLLLL